MREPLKAGDISRFSDRPLARSTHRREQLRLCYGWFTEGFDTRDLLEAKALLHAFAS
jgi:hypothetical protein